MNAGAIVLATMSIGLLIEYGNGDSGMPWGPEARGRDMLMPALMKNKSCQELDHEDREDHSSMTEGNLSLVLYRVDGWDDDNLGTGKWIGVVRREDTSPDDSRMFPGIKKYGCLHFTLFQGEAKESLSTALLSRDGEKVPIKLKYSKLCVHSLGKDPSPGSATTPMTCPVRSRVHFTFQTDAGQMGYLSWDSTGDMDADFRSALTKKYGDNRQLVTDAQIERIAKAFRDKSAGAWFPCAESGCCRVWTD